MSLRKLTIALVPLLLAGCARRSPAERFTHTDPQNPYIMFDQKTAQSCWAGPAQASARPASGEFGEGELTPEESAELRGTDPRPTNPAQLPFCADLKKELK
jgi:hypothetical protein